MVSEAYYGKKFFTAKLQAIKQKLKVAVKTERSHSVIIYGLKEEPNQLFHGKFEVNLSEVGEKPTI